MAHKHVFNKVIFPIFVILIGIATRIIPHAPNFTPVAAMALFGGAYLGKKQAFLLPILVMILSDFIIGFDSLPMRLTIYGTFTATVLIGLWLKNHNKFGNIVMASLISSLLFFVTTNFMVWFIGPMYPRNLAGLSEAYFYAIPFFRNTILGDLFYSGVFFGSYSLLSTFVPLVSVQKA